MGWPPNLVFGLVATAVIFCCIPMAMPQAHLPALCSDLGILASHGAAMLSVLLGTAFISRQFWGWVSDRAGGLNTVLIGSLFQIIAMTAFMLTQDEVGLFTVAAAFGLGFAGIIPAYILAIRELFPASEAYWRIPTFLLCSGSGMAMGELGGRRTLRSLRHLRAGLRRRRRRQCRQSGDRRAAGVSADSSGHRGLLDRGAPAFQSAGDG